MIIYIIGIIAFLLIFAALYGFKAFSKTDFKKVKKIFAVVLIILFTVRYMSYREVQVIADDIDFYKPGAGYLAPAMNTISNFLIWFELATFLFLVCEPFFENKISKVLARYFAAPLTIVEFAFMSPMLTMLKGTDSVSLTSVLFAIELGFMVVLAVSLYLFDEKPTIHKPEIKEIVIGLVIALIATIPTYLPRTIFGEAPIAWHALDFSISHRIIFFIVAIVSPLTLYFLLRSKSQDLIRYALVFITTAVLITFMGDRKYDTLVEPWSYPFHLCNTALFIMPICYIFKPKRLFYFTYFINVMGALFAMLMPNYGVNTNVFAPSLWRFWYNHGIAFWMPLLGVALGVYERPKLKQYGYSIIWLSVYFIIALLANAFLSAYEGLSFYALGMQHTLNEATDYFFLNSDFIGAKLGTWGEDLFRNNVIEFAIPYAQHTVKFHPIYQSLYLIIFSLLGLPIWFVYELFFDISASHRDLRLKLIGIKQDEIALKSLLNGRSIEKPMDSETGVSYKLINFSKKYAGRSVYAVDHANLEVKGGEIFGFLGPNGAGKSTIIKSTVGIQPIVEGNIQICGYDVKTQPIQAKSLIGFVPDHYALYEKLTGREYLNYIADIYRVSKEDRDERIAKYVKLFELEGAIDNKIKTYSHGMKQKVTIMSALVHDPKIWILDEPLTGLDPQSIYQVKQCMIEHAKRGNIVFFSSHIIDIVEKLCDRVAIIKKGHILCCENTADIEKEHGSLETYYLDMIGDTVTERK